MGMSFRVLSVFLQLMKPKHQLAVLESLSAKLKEMPWKPGKSNWVDIMEFNCPLWLRAKTWELCLHGVHTFPKFKERFVQLNDRFIKVRIFFLIRIRIII